ncbi:MAG: lipocalin family protein [Paludibacteraceae bacterium]
MKNNIVKFIIFTLICAGQTGCFIIAPSSQSTTSGQSTSSTTTQMLAKRWRGLQVYKVAGNQMFDNHGNTSGWMQFNANGTCYEKGFLGTDGNQQLRWSVSGKKLTISGGNLVFGGGDLSDTKITYDIVSITDNELHLSRWDGQKPDGTSIIRHLIFTY